MLKPLPQQHQEVLFKLLTFLKQETGLNIISKKFLLENLSRCRKQNIFNAQSLFTSNNEPKNQKNLTEVNEISSSLKTTEQYKPSESK